MHLTFSQPQVQSFSGAAAVIGVLLYWSKDVVNLPITMIAFVQLGSFALHFGSQLWVTFIAGFIMFRVLSRQTFGHVQSFLFPAFFLLSFTMAIITMTTYLMLHQSAPWSWSKAFMVSVLAIGAAGAMANCLVFAPGTIAAMLDRGAAEQKLGVASVVGKIDSRSHRAANAKYNQLHMRFVRWHCYSSLTNVLTLVANLIFMYDVARRLTLS